jgi:hypothetical protein
MDFVESFSNYMHRLHFSDSLCDRAGTREFLVHLNSPAHGLRPVLIGPQISAKSFGG